MEVSEHKNPSKLIPVAWLTDTPVPVVHIEPSVFKGMPDSNLKNKKKVNKGGKQ
jgi:hypothetical protein